MAECVHFIHCIVPDFTGGPLPIFLRKKRVLTEMFSEQMQDLFPMGSGAENIIGILGFKFSVVEHPIGTILGIRFVFEQFINPRKKFSLFIFCVVVVRLVVGLVWVTASQIMARR